MAQPRKNNRPKSYYREPVRSVRSQGDDDERFVALLRVDVDWCSRGIWQIPSIAHPYAGVCVTYESLDLPQWLIDRFDYWTSWHDIQEPWNSREGVDSALYSAYAMSLAIDLKRHLGDNYYIECNGREIHDDRAYLERHFSK
jgi:hypothetical protein